MAGEKTVPTGDGGMGVLQLLNSIVGSDTKTKSTANIAPLQSVMDQIAASQGTMGQQLLESIFSQAAGAVPGIMGNTFNASGSRAPSTQMAGTLQKLMADTVRQAQAQFVQQQQQAQNMQLQAASQIANATRGQTTSQKSRASDTLAKAGKVLAANNMIQKLTGKNLINSGANALKGLLTPSTPSLAATSYNPLSTSFSAPLFGGSSMTSFGSPDVLSMFGITSPMSGETGSLPDLGGVTAGTETPLYSTGSDVSGSLSALPSAADIASIMGGEIAPTDLGSYDFSGVQMQGFQPTAQPDAAGLSSSPSGGDSGSLASDAATALKIYSYAKSPDARKDILDFSDGNFADDVGDITDAGAIYYPPLAAVRPALNSTMAAGESLDNFVHNPGQWFEDLFSGDEPMTQNLWNTAVGTVQGTADAIGDLGQDIIDFGGNAVDEVGDFFGDVFGW